MDVQIRTMPLGHVAASFIMRWNIVGRRNLHKKMQQEERLGCMVIAKMEGDMLFKCLAPLIRRSLVRSKKRTLTFAPTINQLLCQTIVTMPWLLQTLRSLTRVGVRRAWQCRRPYHRSALRAAAVNAAELQFGQPLFETHPHLVKAGESMYV
jgi:flagellar biosynthesis protein FliQ